MKCVDSIEREVLDLAPEAIDMDKKKAQTKFLKKKLKDLAGIVFVKDYLKYLKKLSKLTDSNLYPKEEFK